MTVREQVKHNDIHLMVSDLGQISRLVTSNSTLSQKKNLKIFFSAQKGRAITDDCTEANNLLKRSIKKERRSRGISRCECLVHLSVTALGNHFHRLIKLQLLFTLQHSFQDIPESSSTSDLIFIFRLPLAGASLYILLLPPTDLPSVSPASSSQTPASFSVS